MSSHGRPTPPTAEQQIVKLTHVWVGQCHGLDIAIPIGAALNVIYTCLKNAPATIRQAGVITLRGVADRLERAGATNDEERPT